ncbi:MAG: FG-GAP repeat protein [Planctomycetota bacterium]
MFDALLVSLAVSILPAQDWTYFKASAPDANDFFGYRVAMSGDTLVVGAQAESSSATGVDGDRSDDGAAGSGAAYVFVRSGTTWAQQAYLKASNTDVFDRFGYAVAISGDTVVVGAPNEDSAATGVDGDQSDDSAASAGAVYVFVRSGSVWSQQAYLKASNTDASDRFGQVVAIDGDTLVVGAPFERSAATA